MIYSSRKIRRVSDYLKLDKLIVWLWISCIFVTVVSSQDNFYASGRFGKRKDPLSVSQFPSGSRYGRSEGRSAGNSLKESSLFSPARFGRSEAGKSPKESPKLFEIEPRVDRFYLGSRYGKRSSQASQRAPPEGLNYRRFEAAIDYLDRVKQDLAEAEEVEEETRNASRDDELVEAVYPYAYPGRSKI